MVECEKIGCNNEAIYLVESNAPNGPDKRKCGKCTAKAQQLGQKHNITELN